MFGTFEVNDTLFCILFCNYEVNNASASKLCNYCFQESNWFDCYIVEMSTIQSFVVDTMLRIYVAPEC